MTTTTSYGTWTTRVERLSANFETYVLEAFDSEGPDGFDIDAIEADYRNAINDALPDSVSLCGSEFYGPYESEDWAAAGYPTDEDGRLDIKAIVETIDFWEIVARHDS
ncbi:hypothetical protein ABZW49_10190 [Nonomuraea wenchangensis]